MGVLRVLACRAAKVWRRVISLRASVSSFECVRYLWSVLCGGGWRMTLFLC